jgi:signal transduction histidine kinase
LPGQTLSDEFIGAENVEVSAALRRERTRIARELHDQVVQELILAVMSLRSLSWSPTSIVDDANLPQAQAAVSRALDQARRFLGDLRARECAADASEQRMSLEDILQPIVAMAEQNAQVEMEAGPASDIMLSARVAREVDMILREAVVNACRHAGACAITCRVSREGGRISVEVVDDGCGFEPREGVEGFGLLGMAERANAMGATLEIRSRPGGGTVVRLQLAQTTMAPA